jgi:4-hydroxy-tetrahydrodipicolinate reductase
MATRVGIIGASGRMGAELVKAVCAKPNATLAAALVRPGSKAVGQDAGILAGQPATGIRVSSDLKAALLSLDVVIDFSRAEAVAGNAEASADAGVALMIGTTGLSPATQQAIDAAARRVPVLVSANTSLALNVLINLVRRAAQALPGSYDIEIVEAHHRHKVDAPSGTALALGDAAAAGRGIELSRPAEVSGIRPGARREGAIGFAVARGGDVVGEHEVRFLGSGEQLRLSHIATDRAIFAQGALAAALWLAGRPANRYQMADFLFEKQQDV